jgi:lactoylglutathione lyase
MSEDRFLGHLPFEAEDIYTTCSRLQAHGAVINRPPRDGQMAFVRSPDRQSIELLQKGEPLAVQEPWSSMPSVGKW